MFMTDTIAAISTPYGTGGIAVIRLSGADAIAMAERLGGKQLTRPVHFCRIADLDDVVITTYRAPHSFTGEDVVEISCHGSLYIQQEIMRRLLALGARTARGGEFTQRAFMNGKMDLTQAEAVADLIAAETQAEKDLALSQMRGGVSKELDALRERLLKLTSLLELELDFADHEELEFADRSELRQLAVEIGDTIKHLTDSFQTGNAIKNGLSVALVGKTNAGKSTLLNALLGDDRAIVSDIAGTTRDTVEDTCVIDGVLFRLIDTAGLRDTTDTVENLGIARTKRAIEQAAVVVEIIDATCPQPTLQGDNVVHIYNKADLMTGPKDADKTYISAKEGDIAPLRQILSDRASRLHPEGTVISSERHYEALCRAQEAIQRVQQGLDDGLSGELLSEDLQDCLHALGEITGQITGQEVLNNIFSKFCIGK